MAFSPLRRRVFESKVGTTREEGWKIVDCRDEASSESKETRCIVLMSMMRSTLRLR